MTEFLNKIIDENKFELLIDTQIFEKDIILKAAFNYLDQGYFYFKYDENNNIILQFTVKQGVKFDAEYIIGEFSDTLLETYLRDKLEKDNKVVREAIVNKAINGPIDKDNFVSFDKNAHVESNQVDFDKDIEDILAEIENDPDLQIDQEEIQSILNEIEEESNKVEKPTIQVNPDAIKNIKEQFKK